MRDILGVLCLLVGPVVSAGSSEQPPTFATSAELIRLDVVVVDQDGRPVEGLTREDFEVIEGGQVRTILWFEPIVVRAGTVAPPQAVTRAEVSGPRAHAPDENLASSSSLTIPT